MMPSAAASLATWISQVGLVVADETEFLSQFYARACDAGLPLSKAIVFVDTLHPIHEGRVQRWEAQAGTARALDYEPTEGERLEQWQKSPFSHLLDVSAIQRAAATVVDKFHMSPTHRGDRHIAARTASVMAIPIAGKSATLRIPECSSAHSWQRWHRRMARRTLSDMPSILFRCPRRSI